MKCSLLTILCLLLLNPLLSAQSESFDFGIGVRVQYYYGMTKGSSNYTASLALGVTRSLPFGKRKCGYVQPAYQLAVNMYGNGLGTNLLKEHKITEIDLVNSFTAATGYRDNKNKYLFEHQAFNHMTASSFIQDTGPYSITIGTSFVANNHKRHQSVGYLGFNLFYFKAGYYNDADPFKRLADLNDRWWTGGVLLQFGLDQYIPDEEEKGIRHWKVQLTYERFTGDVQDAYRLASRVGLPMVPSKNRKELFLNRALTSLSVEHDSGFGGSLSFLGHSRFFDLQDYIHNTQGSAKHFSYAKSYWLMGVKFDAGLYNSKID